MRVLFFDTETTGKWEFSRPGTDAIQPNLVQLGAILREDGVIRNEVNVIVFPDSAIHPKAVEVHGITDLIADSNGLSQKAACLMFSDMLHCADRIVAHNIDFDVKIMKRAFWRSEIDIGVFEDVDQVCTMKVSTDILRLPSPKKNGFKWPTLMEAHKYFTNAGFENAHDAMADVRACISVYDGLKALNIVKEN